MKTMIRLLAKKNQNGFTLVEIAIVLAILGFLSASIVGGIGAFRDSADFKQDERQLKDIKEALLSFVAVNGYLPCPDTDGDGKENREGDNTCTSSNDELPFADLGTHSKNPWGNPYYYLVNQGADSVPASSFASASYFYSDPNCTVSDAGKTTPPCFELGTYPVASRSANDTSSDALEGVGNYDVKVMNGDADNLVSDTPLVVLSLGSNGCPGVADEEQNNCDAKNGTSQTLYKGQQSRQDNDFFDDTLIWLTALEIKRFTPNVLPDGSGGGGNDDPPDDPAGGGSGYVPNQNLIDAGLQDENLEQGDGIHNNDNESLTDGNVNIGRIAGGLFLSGNNIVRTEELHNNGEIELNCGDNAIQIDETLAGQIYESSLCENGGGNNSIRIEEDLHNNGTITLQDGNNLIYIEETLAGSISFGSGNNTVYINGNFHNNGSISGSGGVLYINKNPIPTSKISGFDQVVYCSDPDMDCPDG
ncbi:type II secretion system protein [Thiomicrospira sp. WB1]|uniref:type II secretion system protein n=1 Tax=Thiomicrospira sp. WB1 TaxID=1685380 RepID=UPI0007479B0D|nr:type II secretion system protein [Thiomicrospira sp. WB1]KUJ72910.1 hypothetical protein AVO41_03775 [Thiomicrospira sp. WB1]